MSNVAQVLLQLLEKVPDADTLQRLLEPENLLYLLQQYGYQKDELKQRLTNGTLPGELLLELLEKEPHVDYLLVMLSNTMDTRVEKRVVIDEIINQGKKKKEQDASIAFTPVADSDTAPKVAPTFLTQVSPSAFSTTVSDEGKNLFDKPSMKMALVIITLTSIFPALMRSGFFPEFIPTPELTTVIALIGGAIAGALFSSAQAVSLWKGLLMGIVFNLGVLWTTIVYTQARPTLFRIEIVIPLFLGSLPAVGLYFVLGRKSWQR